MRTTIALFLLLPMAAQLAAAADALDLAACIRLGVERNLRLRNAAIERGAAEADASGAEGIYDSLLSADYVHSDSGISEAGSFISGDTKVHRGSMGLSRVLSSGTTIGLSATASSVEQDFGSLGEIGGSFDVRPYSSELELSVSQPLLRNAFGESDKSMVRQARYGAEIAAGMYEREAERLRLLITEAYWDLYAAEANRNVGAEALRLANLIHESNLKKRKDNLIDETDKLATEVLVENRAAELTQLRNTVRNAHDNLARIIRVPKAQWSEVEFAYPDIAPISNEDNVLADSSKLFAAAFRARKDLAAMRLRVKQAELDVKRKEDALDPDLSIFGAVARGGTEDDFSDTTDLQDTSWSVGLSFRAPLSRTREKSLVRKAKLAKEAAVNELQRLTDAVNQECRAAARSLRTSRALLAAAEKAVSLLEKKWRLETDKYNQGRSDIRWVIQAQDELAHTRMSYHVTYAGHRKARAACLAVQGIKLKGGAE